MQMTGCTGWDCAAASRPGGKTGCAHRSPLGLCPLRAGTISSRPKPTKDCQQPCGSAVKAANIAKESARLQSASDRNPTAGFYRKLASELQVTPSVVMEW